MHNSYHNENNRREIKFYDPCFHSSQAVKTLLETICEANRYLHDHDNKYRPVNSYNATEFYHYNLTYQKIIRKSFCSTPYHFVYQKWSSDASSAKIIDRL